MHTHAHSHTQKREKWRTVVLYPRCEKDDQLIWNNFHHHFQPALACKYHHIIHNHHLHFLYISPYRILVTIPVILDPSHFQFNSNNPPPHQRYIVSLYISKEFCVFVYFVLETRILFVFFLASIASSTHTQILKFINKYK